MTSVAFLALLGLLVIYLTPESDEDVKRRR